MSAAVNVGGQPEYDDDEGSIGMLTIGMVLILLLVAAAVAAVSSIYVEQRRLQLVADQCSDAATSRITGLGSGEGPPSVELDETSIVDSCARVLREVPHGIDGVVIAQASLQGPTTARVTLTGTAHPPLVTFFIPEGVTVEATSSSRVIVTQ